MALQLFTFLRLSYADTLDSPSRRWLKDSGGMMQTTGARGLWVRMGVLGCALLLGACGGGGGSSDGADAGGGSAEPFGNVGGENGGGTDPAGGPGGAVEDPLACGVAGDADCPEGFYCVIPADSLQGRCERGCRQSPNSCNPPYECNDDHECVFEQRCEEDLDCGPDLWCDAGACVPGCKLSDPDLCPTTPEGRIQACDGATRTCVPVVVCCADNGDCSQTLPGGCAGETLDGVTSCFNPNPCINRCESDDDCEDDAYCDPMGYCALGCRPDDARACPPGQTCNPDTHTCIFRSCQIDDDCPAAQFCSENEECVIGCRQNPDNCAQGSFCQDNRQCGDGCEVDADCVGRNGPGWYCAESACQRPCMRDADCAEDALCNLDTQRCELGCRDDRLEDNDALAEATPLVFVNGTRYDSAGQALRGCDQDPDFYAFEVPEAGWTVTIHVEYTRANGDIDARLYDPSRQVVALGEHDDDDEDLVFPRANGIVAPSGTYVLEVYARGFDRNDYALTIELTPPGGCVPDASEAGGGDDAAISATPLPLPDLQSEFSVEGRTLCPADEDWFQFRMGERDGLSVQLDVFDMADVDFAVFGPGLPDANDAPAFVPNAFEMGPDGTRTLSMGVPRFNAAIQNGTYYVRVFGADANEAGSYTLTVGVDRERPLCLDDLAEPNDASNRAYDLMLVDGFTRPRVDGQGDELTPGVDLRLDDLWLCSGEQDWFRVVLGANDTLTARIERREAEPTGDTRIEVRDANGRTVGQFGRSSTEVNVARAGNLPAGTYFVSLVGFADTQTNYDLVLTRESSPLRCTPDGFEDAGGNDVRMSAADIAPGPQPNLTLCGFDGDEDWFVFETEALADFTVSISFIHAQGDLELAVYRDGAVFAENEGRPEGHSSLDGETVVLRNRQAGRYLVRVYGLGDPNVRYDLSVDVRPREFQCVPDPDEPNASGADATYLGEGQINGRGTQWLCDAAPRDEDWFQVDIPRGVTRSVLTTFVYGDDGDLYFDVLDDDQMLRASTSEIPRSNSKQCAIIDAADADRTFFIRVTALNINRVLEDDERLDYLLYLVDGDDCDVVGAPSFGADWPRIGP